MARVDHIAHAPAERSEPAQLRVGFIGLGDIGGPMAARLIENGVETSLWARRDASLLPYPVTGYRRADDPADLALSSDVVGICVFGDEDVRQVMLGGRGILAGMKPGGVVVIHATIRVATAEELAAAAAKLGIAVLDAPISGGRMRAQDGSLSIMVGGERGAFEKALPVLRNYGHAIERLGPVGSGLKMKLVNNVLGFANISLAWRAIEIAKLLGLDEAATIKTLRASSGSSFMLDALVEKLMGNPDYARHASTMTEKDTHLFQDVCAAACIDPSQLDQAAQHAVEIVAALGHAGSNPDA